MLECLGSAIMTGREARIVRYLTVVRDWAHILLATTFSGLGGGFLRNRERDSQNPGERARLTKDEICGTLSSCRETVSDVCVSPT